MNILRQYVLRKLGDCLKGCILLALISLTQGCMNVATTGAQAVYNHHSIEKNLRDNYLTMQAYQTLYIDNDEFKDTNIAISTYHEEMLLAGQVPNAWQRIKAEQEIREVADPKIIYNLITIRPPTSVLKRMSDTWITTKIKTKLIASRDVDVTQVKVVTENGTVYLMGVLLPEQAKAAVDVASNTAGVQNVVKIFSYLKISKRLDS